MDSIPEPQSHETQDSAPPLPANFSYRDAELLSRPADLLDAAESWEQLRDDDLDDRPDLPWE
ncbi:MAG: hypothetical protein EBU30_12330 [Synechococcaceae bacterium WB6_3B_236]|jgi:hypothetical protein|nr:hypothetical protein [Synechococcaceae bacterium WB6_3B_236]